MTDYKKTAAYLIMVAVVVSGFWLITPKGSSGQAVLEKHAEKVFETCKKENYRPSCYDREIPELMDEISMEDAFKVAFIIQEKDKSYFYCHVLGHELSAREVKKDPSKWKDVITRAPPGLCSNGGIHGAFQERFKAEYLTDEGIEKIKPELQDICEPRDGWFPTGLQQGSCYHALGHLSMFITNARIEHSLELCDELALKSDGRDYRPLCYDGVFMQIFQSLEPEDFALIEGQEVSLSERIEFCASFDGEKRNSCWFESWPLIEDLTSPEKAAEHCSGSLVPERDRQRCFGGIFRIVSVLLDFNNDKITGYCSMLPEEISKQCFASIALRMVETDYRNISKATNLCQSAKSPEQESYCFKDLAKYSTFNFQEGSKEHLDLCGALPEEWQQECL